MTPFRFSFRVAAGRLLPLLLALVVLTGCATNTMTGRAQFRLVSDEGAAERSAQYYRAMVQDFDSKEKLVEEGPVKVRIETITNRLIEQAVLYRPEAREWNWRVIVIDDPETVNAFCMPGGLMGIYTGLIEKLDATDDEIAQVMGHEIGHALAGHGAEKMSVQVASNIAVLVGAAMVAREGGDFNTTHQVMTLGALAFVNLPNSRGAESEADRIGIELAARAGYDPAAAVSLWNKMQGDKGGGSDFFKTHPSSEKRAEALAELHDPMSELTAASRTSTWEPHDWLNGAHHERPVVDASRAIALYSPEWDRFRKGETELEGGNVAAYILKQRALSRYREESRWRDLAHHVIELDDPLDAAYAYLYEAAQGLGYSEAALRYADKAVELSRDERFACTNRTLVACPEGWNVGGDGSDSE